MKLPLPVNFFRSVKNWIFAHRIIAAVILIIIFIALYFLWPKPPKLPETAKVKNETITQTITASGKIVSENSVDLSFLAGGKLVYVGAKKGDDVKKGQVIASLDQRTVEKNLQSALRDYASARNDFEDTKDDNAEATPQTAPSEEIRRILENSQNDLDKAVISVELQTLAREQSVLVSPIDGILTKSGADKPGMNISPTTVYSIEDLDNLVFQIDVDEADVGKITLGMPAKITLDAYPDDPIRVPISYIDFTSHKTDTGANAYTVEAKLSGNKSQKYRIGMSGDAEIITSEKPDVLTIPISAVEDEKYVYVKKDNLFVRRKVILGIQSDIDVEVISGLKSGEQVALQPEEAAKFVKKK